MRLARRVRVVPDHLVGIDHHVQNVMYKLGKNSLDVRFVIIHGMGGIGKTTLANVIFNQIACQFDGCSFLSDISQFSQHGKIVKLQKRLLSDIFKSKSIKVHDTDVGIDMIRGRCRRKKVLIVLDNLDKRDQLMKLAEKCEWFGPGSRIIVTTRDISIFRINHNTASMHPKVHHYYEMKEMDEDYAIQLFSKHAFESDAPPHEYDKITREIVSITGGLPLALVVIGSSLCWVSEEEWDDVLAKLKEIPHKEVQEVLEVSYDMLDNNQKEIFLDIACHMAGERKEDAIIMWSACKFYPNEAIPILVNKSLIKIKNDHILMHDQLKNLGRELVRRESIKDPEERSRIWCTSTAMDVIRKKEGTKKIVALRLGGQFQVCNISREDISRLVKLRFLELVEGNFLGDFQNLLSELTWFSWRNCPPEFQATNFSPSNLVVLKISDSDITNDWGGWSQIMGNCHLKVLHLVSCGRMIKTPDFSMCSTLERLVVKDCDSLVEIDPSITMLRQLKHLVIKGCNGLRVLKGAPTTLDLGLVRRQSWPESWGNLKCLATLEMENLGCLELSDSIGEIASLQVLSLRNSYVDKLPESIGKLKSLVKFNISFTSIRELPDSIGELKRLEVLNMKGCKLRKLPKAIGMMEKLQELNALHCIFLKGQIPKEIGAMSSLKKVRLSGSRISKVPPSISRLSQLTHLHLELCEELQQLPELPTSLVSLNISRCSAIRRIPDLSNLTNLSMLYFSAPPKACQAQDLQWIGRLTRLSRLALDIDATALPADFTSTLPKLEQLRLLGSAYQSLGCIPPKIKDLAFYNLESTDGWSNLHNFKYLRRLEIRRSCLTEIPLNALGQLENLRSLMVSSSSFLERVSHLQSLRKLRILEVKHCRRLVQIQGLEHSESLEKKLTFYYCSSLKELPDLSSSQNLSELSLSRCHSLESLPVVNRATCLNVFKCKKLRHPSSPEFARVAEHVDFIWHLRIRVARRKKIAF